MYICDWLGKGTILFRSYACCRRCNLHTSVPQSIIEKSHSVYKDNWERQSGKVKNPFDYERQTNNLPKLAWPYLTTACTWWRMSNLTHVGGFFSNFVKLETEHIRTECLVSESHCDTPRAICGLSFLQNPHFCGWKLHPFDAISTQTVSVHPQMQWLYLQTSHRRLSSDDNINDIIDDDN